MTAPIRARYRFSHRANGRYYWDGPRIPGDSRSEIVSCRVDWFWNIAGAVTSERA